MVKEEQLNILLAGYFDRGKQTLEMQLRDGPSSDRHAWAAAAGEHRREVYRDDDNNVDIQQQRLIRLQHLAQREINAGWQTSCGEVPRLSQCPGKCYNGQTTWI